MSFLTNVADTQAIINLSEEAHFNLLSACNNIGKTLSLSALPVPHH